MKDSKSKGGGNVKEGLASKEGFKASGPEVTAKSSRTKPEGGPARNSTGG